MIEKQIIFFILGIIAVYYITLTLHMAGIISLTKSITLTGKIFIPFYLWIKNN